MAANQLAVPEFAPDTDALDGADPSDRWQAEPGRLMMYWASRRAGLQCAAGDWTLATGD
jgi:hypothetical protein